MWKKLLGRCDQSSVAHCQAISGFLRFISLKKPNDETTAIFLQMLIEFIMFVGSQTLGVVPVTLKLPDINIACMLIEMDPSFLPLAASTLKKKPRPVLDTASTSSLFVGFLLDSLHHINDLQRNNLGTETYCRFLIQSVSAVRSH